MVAAHAIRAAGRPSLHDDNTQDRRVTTLVEAAAAVAAVSRWSSVLTCFRPPVEPRGRAGSSPTRHIVQLAQSRRHRLACQYRCFRARRGRSTQAAANCLSDLHVLGQEFQPRVCGKLVALDRRPLADNQWADPGALEFVEQQPLLRAQAPGSASPSATSPSDPLKTECIAPKSLTSTSVTCAPDEAVAEDGATVTSLPSTRQPWPNSGPTHYYSVPQLSPAARDRPTLRPRPHVATVIIRPSQQTVTGDWVDLGLATAKSQ